MFAEKLQISSLSASILFWQHQPGMSRETLEGLFHSNLESFSQVMVFRRIALWMSGMLRLVGLLSWWRDQWWPSVLSDGRLRRRLWSLASNNIVNIIMCPCLWYRVSGLILLHVVLINDGPEKILTRVSDWFYTLSESGYTESCMLYVCFTFYFEDPAWTCMYVDDEINILL